MAEINHDMIAQEVLKAMMDGFKDEKGIHLESFLTHIASLAGTACLHAAFEAQTENDNVVIDEVKAEDGKTYYFAEAISFYLFNSPSSVYHIALEGVPEDRRDKVDTIETFTKFAIDRAGSEDYFDIPSLAGIETKGTIPFHIEAHWDQLKQGTQNIQAEIKMPDIVAICAICLAHVLNHAQNVLPSEHAFKIALEAASVAAHSSVSVQEKA